MFLNLVTKLRAKFADRRSKGGRFFLNNAVVMQRAFKSKDTGAYTLVEIMLVLAIISVLVGAGIYYLAGSLDIAKEQRAEADIQTLTTQLRTYEMQNLFLPTTVQGLEALVTCPISEPKPKRWRALMKKLPIDPWGMQYQYKYPGVKNPDSFDLYSLGPDRVESRDDIGNWEKS